ncbi:MAG: radical SAM family heme chaperone HemW [Capnocytophaga sp.]|nr:radical SAM family heme chaperone HemW [Capnocytophaga sp.]
MYSLYLHIPFCRQACYYCDFHFSTTLKHKSELVEALCKELILRKKEAKHTLQTIYFGGGTPSVLNFNELKQIFNVIYSNYSVSKEAEITIEVNPDDFSKERNHLSLEQLKELGINRLSIGVQSFFDEDLELMNRIHNAEQSKQIIKNSINLFKNITIDLIYGIPKMSNLRWKENINIALHFGIPHISAYALTVEPKTALEKFIQKGKIPSISDEVSQEQFFILKETLEKEQFIHYELSNFGKEGFFSKNNTAYWEQKSYMGIGPSAHSYNGTERSWNISNNIKYIQAIEQNILPSDKEILTLNDKYNELIMTGLRTKKGISLHQIKNDIGEKYFLYLMKEASKFINNEMLILEDNFIKISQKSIFLSDGIASELFYVD